MTNDDIRIEAFRALIEKTATSTKHVELGMAYNHGKYRSTTIHSTGKIVRVKKDSEKIVKIATAIFGPPNGEASNVAGQDDRTCTWWLNGKTAFTGAASKKAIEKIATVIGKNEMNKPNLAAVLIHLHQETTWTPHGDEYRCEYRPNVSVYIRFRKSHISISGYPGGTEEFEKFAGVADKDFLKNGKHHQNWIYPVGD